MGRYNFAAARVYETATRNLEANLMKTTPTWYKTVEALPPGAILTRPQPVQHQSPRKNRTKKASKLFKPQRITFEEDKMRKEFYSHHPWELARPRELLETDGKDQWRTDWSKMQQTHKPLDGESVIQRQLWLLNNVDGMTSSKAYDIARQEFYALRHEEEVERRIAREEAMSTGAYFGKSRLEIGMELEDKVYEEWKKWAIQESEKADMRDSSAFAGSEELELELQAAADAEK